MVRAVKFILKSHGGRSITLKEFAEKHDASGLLHSFGRTAFAGSDAGEYRAVSHLIEAAVSEMREGKRPTTQPYTGMSTSRLIVGKNAQEQPVVSIVNNFVRSDEEWRTTNVVLKKRHEDAIEAVRKHLRDHEIEFEEKPA